MDWIVLAAEGPALWDGFFGAAVGAAIGALGSGLHWSAPESQAWERETMWSICTAVGSAELNAMIPPV